MNIEKEHVFQVPREELWNLLLDPTRLVHCIPGCENLEAVGPDVFHSDLKVGVASIKGTYAGRVEISEKQFPSHYKLSVEGEAPQGFVSGLASINLAEQGARETRLSIKADAQVSGLIASVGQRFLSGIAKQMLGLFFRNIEKELLADGVPRQAAERIVK